MFDVFDSLFDDYFDYFDKNADACLFSITQRAHAKERCREAQERGAKMMPLLFFRLFSIFDEKMRKDDDYPFSSDLIFILP